jgi:hypothetical protein
MTDCTFAARQEGVLLRALAARALLRRADYHTLWIVYEQLWLDAEDRVAYRSTEQLGAHLGLTGRSIKRALRVLKLLGLVVPLAEARNRYRLGLPLTGDAETQARLAAVRDGTLLISVADGKLYHSEGHLEPLSGGHQEPLWNGWGTSETPLRGTSETPLTAEAAPGPEDATPSNDATYVAVCDGTLQQKSNAHPLTPAYIAFSESSVSVRPSNTSTSTKSIYSENSHNAAPPAEQPAAPTRRKRGGLDPKHPTTDPRWSEVEEVQAFANELFSTRHTLVNSRGELIGERAKVIYRALVTWEYSVDDLCTALRVAATDPWWRDRGITDLTKLLRKDEHVRAWLDAGRSGRGVKQPTGKWDRKQTDLAAGGAFVDRSRIESFEV